MLAEPKELERLVLRKEIYHGDNPVLTWCLSNVVAKMDEAGWMKPDKKRAKEKIDAAVAILIAIGADGRFEDDEPESEVNIRFF